MPPPPKVRGLVIDLDGVLRHFDEARTHEIEESFGLPEGIIARIAFEPRRLQRAVTGAITDDRWRYEVAVDLAEMWGGDTAAAAVTAWAALPGRFDEVALGLVARVAENTPTVLLTNATTRLESDLMAAGLERGFAAVISSARTGFAKPDPRSFAAAEEALSSAGAVTAVGGVAYVDDDPGNVAAARERGWDAWRFTTTAELGDWLDDRGLLAPGSRSAGRDLVEGEPLVGGRLSQGPSVSGGGLVTRGEPVSREEPESQGEPRAAAAAETVTPWTRLAERPGLSAFVRATTVTFRLPDGTIRDWDLIHEADAVAILALTDDRRVVLARQYRPGPDAVLDELPGGLIDDGEDPAEAAARELVEETGYAGRVEVLSWAWQDGRSTRRMWTAVATGCRPVAGPRPGPSESIEVVLVTLDTFLAQVRAGALTDAARAYRALDHLGLLTPPSTGPS